MAYQVDKNTLEGEKFITFNPPEGSKKDEVFTFEEGEAYTVDILLSTGEGKHKTTETRPTIYKKVVGSNYQLKMKTSRAVSCLEILSSPLSSPFRKIPFSFSLSLPPFFSLSITFPHSFSLTNTINTLGIVLVRGHD